jgi:hypothetical protein
MGPPVYSKHFECFWDHSDKLGSKSDAFRAWEQVGSPPPDRLMASRSAWLQHWAGIGVKHIATWLRAFDWQQEPAPRLPNGNGHPPARNFREEATEQAFAAARAQMAKLKGGKS